MSKKRRFKMTAVEERNLKALAREWTRLAVVAKNKLPLHYRFACPECKQVYCLNNDGKVVYCKQCPILGNNHHNCGKDVEGMRDCEIC